VILTSPTLASLRHLIGHPESGRVPQGKFSDDLKAVIDAGYARVIADNISNLLVEIAPSGRTAVDDAGE
jgi:hypothetical protein